MQMRSSVEWFALGGLLVLSILVGSGCRNQDAAEGSSTGAADFYAESEKAQAPLRLPVEAEKATDSTEAQRVPLGTEIGDFSRSWVNRINVGEANLINALLDWDLMDRKATSGIECPEELREKFLAGLSQQRTGPDGFDGGVAKLIQDGGSYHFLRHRIAPDGRALALFRVVMPQRKGVNYHEVEVALDQDGVMHGVDVLIYRTGLTFTEIFRNSFLEIVAQDERVSKDSLEGFDRAYVDNFPILKQMRKQISAGELDAALASYRQLSPQMQTSKTGLILLVQASKGSSSAIETALSEYRKSLPDALNVDLLAASVFMEQGEYTKALEAIDRFDRAIGGDPYLDVLRAYCHLENRDVVKARESAIQATTELPDLVDGYWARIDISLRDRRYVDTMLILEEMSKQFRLKVDDIVRDPAFSDFVKTRTWHRWTMDRKEREETSPVLPGAR